VIADETEGGAIDGKDRTRKGKKNLQAHPYETHKKSAKVVYRMDHNEERTGERNNRKANSEKTRGKKKFQEIYRSKDAGRNRGENGKEEGTILGGSARSNLGRKDKTHK